AFFEDALATVVVLSLFIPLAISTGGNSGSQAATLIIRALALGQITPGDWFRVLRRELLMGIALGVSLGAIGFLRGAATPSDTRSGPRTIREPFSVQLPPGATLTPDENGDFYLPVGTNVNRSLERGQRVRLPENDVTPPVEAGSSFVFQANCEVRTDPVSRWD